MEATPLMKQRNNNKTHRLIEANERKTQQRIEQHLGICALLRTWETQPAEVVHANHDYIIKLRKRERDVRNYLMHRSDARVDLG